jgi:hypothetical protein
VVDIDLPSPLSSRKVRTKVSKIPDSRPKMAEMLCYLGMDHHQHPALWVVLPLSRSTTAINLKSENLASTGYHVIEINDVVAA